MTGLRSAGADGAVTRTDRLLALVAELRTAAPAPLRAGALAERLAVSERTVQRDIAVLARSGLPVRLERGAQGGYAVEAESGAGTVGLTVSEAAAAAVALENLPAEVVPAAARSALSKLYAALEAGPPGPGSGPGTRTGVAAEISSVASPVRHTVDTAVRAHRVVRIDYRDQSGERTTRDVEAHGLVVAPYGEYLTGWCRLRDAPRLFRLERINAAYLTAGEAGLRDLDELLAVLRVPAGAFTVGVDRPLPGRSRSWTLDRFQHARVRVGEVVGEVRADREGAARLRVLLCHLAEWCRWQVAAVRAVATGQDLVLDGRRPPFPAAFEGPLPYEAREKMIQDAMALRSLPEVARDLKEVLAGAAYWIADCDEALWREPVPDPAAGERNRPLADLLAGWWSPISHLEWHLDRWGVGWDGEDDEDAGVAAATFDTGARDTPVLADWLIDVIGHCPLRSVGGSTSVAATPAGPE